MTVRNDRDQTQKPPPNQRPPAAWWIGVAIMLITWGLIAVMLNAGHSGSTATIPYTTFLGQVEAGNIARVTVTGDQIAGQFVKPYQSNASFQTTFPQAIGDPGLIPLLTSKHVEVSVAPSAAPWAGVLIGWLPTLLLFGFFIWMLRRAGGGQANMFGFGRAKPRRYTSDRPQITFDDVAGADEAKLELQEEVDFLRSPEKYHKLGARIPKGVLLVGAPGTGKTLLARAIAGEAHVPFFSLNASEFVEMFVGVGASRVRDLFSQAKEAAPAIVFIDEIDAVGRRRGAGVGTVNDEREQTLNQLLDELDGFDPRVNIIVLAATNRPDVLDPALLRPGRFDRQVTIDLPDRNGREGILRIHTRAMPLSTDVDLSALAASTIGMSGAELENLCNEAALGAARRGAATVARADLEEALDRVRLGAAHPQVVDSEDRRVVAYHEAGHTVVAWLTPGADPVNKVTVVPHGRALGLTEQLPGQERRNLSRTYLKARLAVALGGRVCEELVFDEITTGAEDDLINATQLARQMVTRWAMGSLGFLAFKSDETQPFLGYELAQNREYSEVTASRIDRDVQRLLDEAHETARTRLAGARAQLDEIVQRLLKEETVRAETLATILGPSRSVPAPPPRTVLAGR